MSNHPSARELVNAATNKKLSPQAQAVLAAFRDEPGSPEIVSVNNQPSPKSSLLQLIDEKLAERKNRGEENKKQKKRPTTTKSASNRENAQHSTGPKTPEGKARISANALKTGFFANVERLNPHDSPAYQSTVEDLRMGLQPDGPVEEQLIRELAMFRARLLRLEAAEYALICSEMETNTGDAREVAAAYLNNAAALEHLQKAEVHLRRAYNRTWDRLERMQKERRKMPLNEALKQTQIYATQEAIRTNRPELIPQRHPAIDEKGNLIKLHPGDPMYRPKEDKEEGADEDESGQSGKNDAG